MSLIHQFKEAVRHQADNGQPKKNAAALPPEPEPAKKSAPANGPVTLRAWKAPSVNPRLLVAYAPGTDPANPNNLVSVQVRSNANFLPGMELRARRVQGTIYDLEGPLPRWRGRW